MSKNLYSQDLYKWSKKCNCLSQNQELYLWVEQVINESKEKNAKKIVKSLDEKYLLATKEIDDFISANKLNNNRYPHLLRNIYFIKQSNIVIKNINSDAFQLRLRYYDDVFEETIQFQKLLAKKYLLYTGLKNKLIAEGVLRDLITVDSTDKDVNNMYIKVLNDIKSIYNDKIDSLEGSIKTNNRSIINAKNDVNKINSFSREKIMENFGGRLLSSKDSIYATVKLSNSLVNKKYSGFTIDSIEQLKFYNQQALNQLFDPTFEEILLKSNKIKNDYEKLNLIQFDKLIESIYKNNGVIIPSILSKFYEEEGKLYYFDGVDFNLVKKENGVTSIQIDEDKESEFYRLFKGNGDFTSYSETNINKKSEYDFLFIEMLIPRDRPKYYNKQKAVFIIRGVFPLDENNKNFISFNFALVNSTLREDVEKIVPHLMYRGEIKGKYH
ncbi:hypothetical protein CQA01_05620 [Cyclobacterium qasimii]|uniref:Uncharacterized protein n=2 Tax=Cyclobacterium qasimii TaxID=1350429 RepID=A0A512C732_9BACT|nr:hypothetical protein CQA01_05620 [Cyclobacterium qasimii]